MRVLLETLQQALDGGLQLGNARFEGADIRLEGNRFRFHTRLPSASLALTSR